MIPIRAQQLVLYRGMHYARDAEDENYYVMRYGKTLITKHAGLATPTAARREIDNLVEQGIFPNIESVVSGRLPQESRAARRRREVKTLIGLDVKRN